MLIPIFFCAVSGLVSGYGYQQYYYEDYEDYVEYIRGPPGPPGRPGRDGRDGRDGRPGIPAPPAPACPRTCPVGTYPTWRTIDGENTRWCFQAHRNTTVTRDYFNSFEKLCQNVENGKLAGFKSQEEYLDFASYLSSNSEYDIPDGESWSIMVGAKRKIGCETTCADPEATYWTDGITPNVTNIDPYYLEVATNSGSDMCFAIRRQFMTMRSYGCESDYTDTSIKFYVCGFKPPCDK